jgi:hypothetical protein
MPRRARKAPGASFFHCLNRGNDRRELFADAGDYAAFERVMTASPAPGVAMFIRVHSRVFPLKKTGIS